MVRILLKKQFSESFKSYFFDVKKNRMRSKTSIILWFAFFFLVMVGLLGGTFTFLAVAICGSMVSVDMGWMYFVIMGGIGIVFGAFGSIFNTFSTLYLAKDNDQLLSLPIPVRTILTARLLTVYLMGTMYSSIIVIPTIVVYWVVAGLTVSRLICGLVFYLLVTIIVMLLSCILGWVVAKISLKLKNKSFVTVLLSLTFIGLYYFFYFRATNLVRDIVVNAQIYGEKLKGASVLIYKFGTIGEGNFASAAVFTAVIAAILALVVYVLSRTFIGIATSSGKVSKARYVEKTVKQKTAFRALLNKEFKRFTSSSTYMLNTGLGLLFIPAMGVFFIVMGGEISYVLDSFFSGMNGASGVLFCAMLLMLSSMCDMSTPSVSLEGKSVWIPQTLPVEAKTVLRAKLCMHLVLCAPLTLFAVVCAATVIDGPIILKLLVVLLPMAYCVFSAIFGLVIGTKMAIMNWTNEMAPIKQSGAVLISIFGTWGFVVVFAGLYLLFAYKMGAVLYIGLFTVAILAASAFLLRWLDTKGAKIFSGL